MGVIVNAILTIGDTYSMIIVVYVLMSWLPQNGVLGDIYHALGIICEPYLGLFRRLIPPIGGMVDITPIIALLVLQFAMRLIVMLF